MKYFKHHMEVRVRGDGEITWRWECWYVTTEQNNMIILTPLRITWKVTLISGQKHIILAMLEISKILEMIISHSPDRHRRANHCWWRKTDLFLCSSPCSSRTITALSVTQCSRSLSEHNWGMLTCVCALDLASVTLQAGGGGKGEVSWTDTMVPPGFCLHHI